ncbi:DUF4097 family beta strand repeat-containing protein [Segetibacter aerophilus]|uniref:Adhesin domain-containing protein n=1 Tax=Segetibacter aerophilus TaxID=670293 RepID=A0A512BB46_9BACT|nr:hypothetical protein [Segetibacter aerophilus]GEO09204.1 hypothetical protein SAE01_17000 [Segetibacter aerophilus]
MKKLLFSLLISSACATLYAQDKNETPYMTKSLSGDAIKNVEVKTSGGSISVTGANPSESRIEVYIHGNNGKNDLSKEEIQQRLNENYDLDVSVSNNKVTAIAKPKKNNMDWKRGLSISFKVFTPQNIVSNLATSGGSISLKNLSGNQDFSTSGGSLHVESLSGKVRGRTSGGSIHVANSKDDINLATSGGSIHAENCDGNLNLATSGGSLNLTDLKGNIEANTSGGSINGSNIKGELITHTSGGSIRLSDLACSLETGTSGGNINVSIKELGKYVRISNSAGSVDIQLPNKGINLKLTGQKVTTAALSNFNGRMEKDEIDGTLNGGGIPVTVRAGSGKVNLSMR